MIDVMICVNNPDNGNYCGRLAGVDIHDFMRLEPLVLPEPRCTLTNLYFSVHRCRLHIHGYAERVGNWCWNSIRVTPEDAAKLVATMLSQQWPGKAGAKSWGIWGIHKAEGEAAIALMDRHGRLEAITAGDVLAAMKAEAVA